MIGAFLPPVNPGAGAGAGAAPLGERAARPGGGWSHPPGLGEFPNCPPGLATSILTGRYEPGGSLTAM
jgi:hypothetical protein